MVPLNKKNISKINFNFSLHSWIFYFIYMVLVKDIIFKYGTEIKIFLMNVLTTTFKSQQTGLRFNHIFVKSSEIPDTLSLLRN